ncbi:MAG: hypothetical protein KI785_02230 [Devosiaceae bacterium]|nr:hypothetical protein [Devosiaceae bacterium MH13]
MIGPIETVRDTANSWECDENDHINVKAYARRFDDAVRFFLVEAGWQIPHRVARLIRYHGELRGGEPVHGTTGMVLLPGGQVALEHKLWASHRLAGDAPMLAATALDVLPDVQRDDLSAFDVPDASVDALPPSGALDMSPVLGSGSLEAFSATYRGVVPPDAFGAELESANGARLTDHYLVGILSDAATHAWGLAGAPDGWFQEHGWGRVAVQLHLRYATRPQAGDAVSIRTAITAHSAKTVSYRHLVFNQMTDTLIAQADVTSLILDLTARRAVPWPPEQRDVLAQRVAAFNADQSDYSGYSA